MKLGPHNAMVNGESRSCDVIKMSEYPSRFREFLSSHLPHFYDVTLSDFLHLLI